MRGRNGMTARAALAAAVAVLGLIAAPSSATPRAHAARTSPVVIAVVESGGLNVLHADFLPRPGADAAAIPAAVGGVPVRLPTRGDFAQRLRALESGPLGSLQPGTMYQILGTRIVGIYSSRSGVDLAVNRSHATATTSAAVGAATGTAPGALLVYVPDTTASAWAWLEHQTWIDVVSTSYTELSLSFPGAREVCASMQRIAAQGRVVFTAAGNGEVDAAALPPSGVPENYQVGGVDADGRSVRPVEQDGAGPTRPYETGDRYTSPVAAPDSLKGRVMFSGTSGSAPSTAGRAADLIAYARQLLHARAGLVGGALAVAGPGAKPPATGPLSDGRLTRDELVTLLHHIAVPAEQPGPTRYLVEGYGALTDDAVTRAKQVLAGDAPLPSRPQEDQANAAVESARGVLFPPTRCG